MKDKLVSAFIVEKEKSYHILRDYMMYDMKIDNFETWDCRNNIIIPIPQNRYKELLLKGQIFILENNLKDAYWLDYYSNKIECGYLETSQAHFIPNQTNSDDIKNYLINLKSFLNKSIKVLNNSYNNYLTILFNSLNYEENILLIEEYINKYSYGPFIEIKKTDIDGKINNNYKIRKKC